MTWSTIPEIFFEVITALVFIYSALLVIVYVLIALYSIGGTKNYLRKNSFTDYRLLAASPHIPSVSVLAPAYNEGKTIVENVRSLLSIYYSNLEVIIINDGSKDDSLVQLIEAYQLEKVDFLVNYQIHTKEVRGIYRSKNPVYNKLVVVDKVNGGKADALNVGINIASNDYLVCIDVDCVLEQDALLKMMKPFMEQTDERVIASGGVVRIANSCIIEDGRLVKVKLPDDYLPRVQTLEYIRAFILGRMAWSRLNGLMLISGAFGAFDKDIVLKCGGYNHNTVGEDMELVVRMRRYMEERKEKYRVTYIPDPLCWTEAPATYTILGRQRNRWTRGTYETLMLHKKMFFNPKYGIMGLLSYPYWFFYELSAPLIEFLGFVAFFFFAIAGLIDWSFFFLYLLMIIFFGYAYSAFAILMEVTSYNMYRRRTDILRLILTAISEPFYFHSFVVWSAIKGFIDLLKKNKGWGEMTRQGFAKKTTPQVQPVLVTATTATTVVASADLPERENKQPAVLTVFLLLLRVGRKYTGFAVVLAMLLLLCRFVEWGLDLYTYGTPLFAAKTLMISVLQDASFIVKATVALFIPFLVLYFIHKKTAVVFLSVLSILLCLTQLSLSEYFIKTLVPLGADLWSYSWNDIRQTVGASGGINITVTLLLLLFVLLSVAALAVIPKKIKPGNATALLVALVYTGLLMSGFTSKAEEWKPGPENSNNLAINKTNFFIAKSLEYFFPMEPDVDIYAANYLLSPTDKSIVKFRYTDEKQYPFLHVTDSSADVFTPFFDTAAVHPNIVIIAVEGLGRAFCGDGAYLGSFTPFIDSLAGKSLYWENFLSEGGRTFALLPSLTASLPFASNGFLEMKGHMPDHLSLFSILKNNHYQTGFYYGGDSRFDNMDYFLQRNGVEHIVDEAAFAGGYTKMPAVNGFTWGYDDKELFRKYFETLTAAKEPYCNFLLTVASHNPFLINNEDVYLQKFEARMNALGFSDKVKQQYRNYKYQYASILFADDAVRQLIEQYRQRPDFDHTVFLITGDHRMPEIPMNSKIDRYHVPLIVYSPLLKRRSTFSSVSTHFDITPTLLQWLHRQYALQIPDTVSWLGSGIDSSRSFRNIHAYPLMQTKTDINDFIMGDYMLNGSDLYKINTRLELEPVSNNALEEQLKAGFDRFKIRNTVIINGGRLLPDSIFKRFAP
ncbi:MAG: sulfatase-like hydrolase/transferase [Bacteroidota bacterium]|nr:sulfatase-like hydrolase/transferase [Bacteroidota bacterium]